MKMRRMWWLQIHPMRLNNNEYIVFVEVTSGEDARAMTAKRYT